MLRCTLLLYFGDQTSCYVAHFCCTPVNTLHTLRCTLLLYVGEHTSCYVARLCCTSVNRLHVTLYAYEFVNHSKGQFTKTACRVQRGSPKVLAHTGTIDSWWKACKKMLPGSLSSHSPMIMTYVKAWQWRYIHRNADVCDITAKTVRKLV